MSNPRQLNRIESGPDGLEGTVVDNKDVRPSAEREKVNEYVRGLEDTTIPPIERLKRFARLS